MRVVVFWNLLSGYIASCWRAFAALPSVEASFLAWQPTQAENIGFSDGLMAGLDGRLLSGAERSDTGLVIDYISSKKPDVIVVSGWMNGTYTAAIDWAHRNGVGVVLAMDNSLRLSPRQYLARWFRPSYLRKCDSVFVPGERAYMLARFLKFGESQINYGAYGFDYDSYAACYDLRLELCPEWPRRFLFAGRYIERKAIDVLLKAYAAYRQNVRDPWELHCCGQGPLSPLLESAPGVTNLGFVQPEDLKQVFATAGAFVLPSRFEAWGVVLAEAAASGLPVVASAAVGASVEVLRDYYNGRLFPTGNAAALADALTWCHDNHARMSALGKRGQELSRPFAAQFSAERLEAACRRTGKR